MIEEEGKCRAEAEARGLPAKWNGKRNAEKKLSVKHSIRQHTDSMTIYEVRHGSTKDPNERCC